MKSSQNKRILKKYVLLQDRTLGMFLILADVMSNSHFARHKLRNVPLSRMTENFVKKTRNGRPLYRNAEIFTQKMKNVLSSEWLKSLLRKRGMLFSLGWRKPLPKKNEEHTFLSPEWLKSLPRK